MHPTAILSGAVRHILCAGKWRDRHILVYESVAHDVLIMEDTMLMQTIHAFDPQPENLVAALHADSGSIAICANKHLVLYDAVEIYGQEPVWRPRAPVLISEPISSVTWASDSVLCVATSHGDVHAYDAIERRIVWHESMGCTQLTGHGPTQRFIAYNSESKLGLLILASMNQRPNAKWAECRVLKAGNIAIHNAWFVTSQLVAVQTEDTTFVWDIDLEKLLVSVASKEFIPTGLELGDDASVLLIGHSSAYIASILDGEPSLQHTNFSVSEFLAQKQNGTAAMATHDRIYTWQPESSKNGICVFKLSGDSLSDIGVINGPQPVVTNNLSCGKSSLLAGTTIVTNGFDSLSPLNSISEVSTLVQSEFLDENLFVILVQDDEAAASLRLYENTDLLWSVHLDGRPVCVGKSDESIGVLFASGILRSYQPKDGTFIRETPLSLNGIEHASLRSGTLLAQSANQVVGIHLSEPEERTTILDRSFGARIDSLCVNNLGMGVAAYFYNNQAYLAFWEATKGTNTISLGLNPVVSLAWSHDSSFLAVMTTESVVVFAKVPALRGSLVKISECSRNRPALTFGNAAQPSICWSEDMQNLFAFNGKQLVALDAGLDEASTETIQEYAIDAQGITGLKTLGTRLSKSLPIYHPDCILLYLQALKSSLVCSIFKKLARAIKFSETTEDGLISLVSPTLDMQSLHWEDMSGLEFSDDEAQELVHALQSHRLAGLTKADQNRLMILVSVMNKSERLDEYALSSFAEATIDEDKSEAEANYRWWAYAWCSVTRPQLQNYLKSLGTQATAIPTWIDQHSLATELDQRARTEFASERDPTSVTLYYLALRKMDALRTLWRVSSGHPEYNKTVKLLSQDFSTARWRNAAQKNAYALLSKHRNLYAAAFFLLSDSIVDCCKVLVDKVRNLELAIAIARVYDGDTGAGMQYLRSRYFTRATGTSSSSWLQVWGSWVGKDPAKALDELAQLQAEDVAAIVLFAKKGGQFDETSKDKWVKMLEEAGVLQFIAQLIVSDLSPADIQQPLVDTTDESISVPDAPKEKGTEEEDYKLPAHLKPAPADIQLEPDMSAFGF